MGHQALINYKHYAVEAISICETSLDILNRMESELDEASENASSVENEQSEELKKSILRQKDELLKSIVRIRAAADSNMNGSGATVPAFYNEAIALKKEANEMASNRVTEYSSLLGTLFVEKTNELGRKRMERLEGTVTIDASTQKVLDSIDDAALRQFTHIAYIRDNTLDGEKLKDAGRELMRVSVEETAGQRLERERQKIRAELEAQRIDKGQIDSIVNASGESAQKGLEQMRSAATDELVGEKVRQKSIQIITKAIEKRGFIVDKKNIKIKRDTNEVVIVAQKANDEKAEFRVFLDGKFIYDFHGYEGTACQKDISPFMNDLEEVYGIHVTDSKIIKQNPDKIHTMKYQTQQTKHDRG